MSRYYYDDPLAAAWMGRHFGMKFEDHSFEFIATSYCDYRGEWFKEPDQERFYIHRDSLPLLEPNTATDLTTSKLGELVSDNPNLYPKQIIMRNGIPFHWPKKEVENNG